MTFTNISSVSLDRLAYATEGVVVKLDTIMKIMPDPDRLAYATEGVVVKLDTIMKILERFVKLQEAQGDKKDV